MWHNTRLLNALANTLFLVTLVMGVGAALIWVSRLPSFAIQSVQVQAAPGEALRHISPQLLKRMVAQQFEARSTFKKENYFFNVPVETLRLKFEQLSWVRSANVKRVWPNRLVVDIEEHKAVAVWSDERLVNAQGELFAANLAEAEEDGPLPLLAGPSEAASQVLKRHTELVAWLAPLNLRPESVTLSTRHAWTIKLDDGTTLLLGREQGLAMEDRIARWVESVPRLQSRLASRPELYDLRYPNGFAVRAVALVSEQSTDSLSESAHNKSKAAASGSAANSQPLQTKQPQSSGQYDTRR